mmetsp:Transcript_28509/g.39693  ORF Transcript_28509/g.39693 Transcript_28509/m.39693 type:complete len:226 (-) Transcript_28509:292-969(-)
MLSTRVFVQACMVLALLVSPISADAPDFDFRKFLKGEWSVEKFTVSMASSETIPAGSGTYTFKEEKETENLPGFWTPSSTESDPDEPEERIPVSVEFDALNTGNFKIGEDLENLFSFYFQPFNGPWISHGEWNGESGGFYQFNVVGSDKFTITIYPHKDKQDAEITLFSAVRVKNYREKTWFEKWGSTLMMLGGFFLWQRMKGDQGRPAGPGATGGPTVEDKKNQ